MSSRPQLYEPRCLTRKDLHCSALVPLSGAIIRHAEYFVDPALSFAQGWNSVYNYLISLPTELTAAAVIVSYWDDWTTAAAWIILFGALLVIANLLFVRVYGEMEFIFATLKIMLIVGCNLMVSIVMISPKLLSWLTGPIIPNLGSCFGLRWWPKSRSNWLQVLEESRSFHAVSRHPRIAWAIPWFLADLWQRCVLLLVSPPLFCCATSICFNNMRIVVSRTFLWPLLRRRALAETFPLLPSVSSGA